MRKVMKIRITISSLLLILPSIAEGQAVPTAVAPISSIGGSPIVPNLDGVLHYAVSGSEIIQFGNYGSGHVAASQGYTARHWIFNVSDSFSFLPQSPTTGLSGIPGVGDLGSIPVQGPV